MRKFVKEVALVAFSVVTLLCVGLEFAARLSPTPTVQSSLTIDRILEEDQTERLVQKALVDFGKSRGEK